MKPIPAQYGDSRSGHPHYRALLDRFQKQALPLSEPLLLNNNGGLLMAMRVRGETVEDAMRIAGAIERDLGIAF